MTNRSVAVHTAFSCLLWPSGLALVLVGLFTRHEVGQLGLIVAMIAAVLNVRGFFVCLEQREHAAFDLGRNSVRSIR